MRVLLVAADGQIDNAVEVESVELAQAIFPGHLVTPDDRAGPGWRFVDGEFIPPEPEPQPMWGELPTYEFLALFTPEEWSAFSAARTTDARIGQLMHILDRAPTVHRTNSLLRSGIAYAVYSGLLTAERFAEIIGETP